MIFLVNDWNKIFEIDVKKLLNGKIFNRPMKHKMNKTVQVSLPLFIFRDEYGYFSAFCPALNIAGQGRDEKSAMNSFDQMVKIFIEETMRKGTFDKVLSELGWTLENHDLPLPPHADNPPYLFSRKEVSVSVPVS